MAIYQDPRNPATIQPQINSTNAVAVSPRTPDSALSVANRPYVDPRNPATIQPQITTTNAVAVSPRTPDSAFAAPAVPGRDPATIQPQNTATSAVGVSPQTPMPATGIAPGTAAIDAGGRLPSVSAVPQAPAAVAAPAAAAVAPPSVAATRTPIPPTALAGTPLDPTGNVRMDMADAYNRGAQSSVATGVGMAAREGIVSPVSRAIGAVSDTAGPVLRSVGEGVRAFITGAPPAPAAAATNPAPSVAAPAAKQVIRGSSNAGPATIDNATGQVVPPTVAAAPQGRTFRQGNLTVTDDGNGNRTIVGDGQQAPPSVASAPQGLSIQTPGHVTSVPTVGATSMLGGLFKTAVALGEVNKQDAVNQRDFKNNITAINTGLSAAKVGGELTKNEAEVGKTQAETTRLATDNADRQKLTDLRGQLVNEQDPAKRKVLENKIYALAGKKQGNFQVTQVESVDPATGMVTKTPYIIDADTGNARPVVQNTAPAGMQYVGKSPDGKRVFQDAQGKKHVEG